MRLTSIAARTVRTALVAGLFLIGSRAQAHAQTTVVLDTPGTQVTDAMVQGGTHAKVNFNASDVLATRASTNPEYLRHALIKFDTQNTIPANTAIASAVMTLTIKSAGTDTARTIGVFPVAASFVEEDVTWANRRAGTPWIQQGGDFGPETTRQTAGNVAGTRISFDVTAYVRSIVSNGSSSRYSRLGLSDLGASSSTSYHEFYSSKALDPAVRPVLTVVYGGSTPPPPPPPPPPAPGTSTILRVMQYNTHHGGWGTDGVYSPDRIVAWIVKLKADVVSLNEIEINDSWSKGFDQTVVYQQLLEKQTGVTWYKVYMNRFGATSGNGVLVLSKRPFIATAGHLLPGGRSAVDATFDVNGRTIDFTSVHLDNVTESNRLQEVADLLPWDTQFSDQRIIAGDYNAWPQTTEIANMHAAYVDTWIAAQGMGTAVGNGITHGAHRIDYIFQAKSATFLRLVSQQIFDSTVAGVMPSDHHPVLSIFEVR
jgi:endonuclease/exonuclease/phosphatase family metal-dependent hydrolase